MTKIKLKKRKRAFFSSFVRLGGFSARNRKMVLFERCENNISIVHNYDIFLRNNFGVYASNKLSDQTMTIYRQKQQKQVTHKMLSANYS